MKEQRAPERMCVVCRQRWPKHALIRIARTESGPVIDGSGSLGGRGAYLCLDAGCWERDRAALRIGQALRSRLGNDALAALRLELERHLESKASEIAR